MTRMKKQADKKHITEITIPEIPIRTITWCIKNMHLFHMKKENQYVPRIFGSYLQILKLYC